MNYWISIVNSENWKIIKNKNIWGVSKRNEKIISQVKERDKIIFYIIKEKVIAGIYEVVSDIYEDHNILFEPTWDSKEVFPYRIKLKPIKIAKEPLQIKSLISDLEFIQNKEYWGSHFFGKAMKKIPKQDFFLLSKIMV